MKQATFELVFDSLRNHVGVLSDIQLTTPQAARSMGELVRQVYALQHRLLAVAAECGVTVDRQPGVPLPVLADVIADSPPLLTQCVQARQALELSGADVAVMVDALRAVTVAESVESAAQIALLVGCKLADAAENRAGMVFAPVMRATGRPN